MKHIIAILILVFNINFLQAFDLEVDILNNNYNPITILIADFVTDKPSKDYYKVLKNNILYDLEQSGVFYPRFIKEDKLQFNNNLKLDEIDFSEYGYYPTTLVGSILYDEIKAIYIIKFMLIDNYTKEIKTSYGYDIKSINIEEDIVKISHDISNEVYKSILGIEGYFNTYLVYVGDNKLMLSDYAGRNKKELLSTQGKILGPVFSHNNRYVAYVDFINGHSTIYLYDFYFDKKIKIADFLGLSLSPRFSRKDKTLLFSIAYDGATNIFELNLENKKTKKLSNNYFINLPGGYSYDEEYIIFNSDRSGSPNIYVMTKDGKNIKRISKGEGSYYNPSFAPNNNIILFTKIVGGQFYIGVMTLDGKEKIITKDPFTESPSWFLDGRHVIYQYSYDVDKKNRLYSFYILDIISGHKQAIKPAINALNPTTSNGFILNKKLRSKYTISQISENEVLQ